MTEHQLRLAAELAFARAGLRIVSCVLHGFLGVVEIRCDHAVGKVKLSELCALADALDLPKGNVEMWPASSTSVEIFVDVDATTPIEIPIPR